ncbi:unnamed protein product, partial [Didymodactylos carnosus]
PDIKFDKPDPGESRIAAMIQKQYQQELPLQALQIAQATRKDAILKFVYDYILSENSKQPVKAPLQQWKVPDKPWQRIHIDFTRKFTGLYFLIIVDAHSKWLEVLIMNNISTKATVDALSSLFARYGLCEEIISDNGTQFTSEEFADFCARNGIRHSRTSAAHPQSNGPTPHPTTNASPAELFFKRQLWSVLDLLRPNVTDASSVARKCYQLNFDRRTKERYFYEGSRIWIVKEENYTWRRHREYSSDEDIIIMDSTPITDQTTSTTTDHNKGSSTSSSSSDQDSQIVRRSSRLRKPVQRLIEEI